MKILRISTVLIVLLASCGVNSAQISEAPSNLAVSNTTAISFCITISPPINNTQNGPIQTYTVSYQGELFNTTQMNVSVSVVVTYPLTASSSLCINGLEEFNNYTVSVRAINGAGEGAAITRVFRTLASAPITAPQNVFTTSITATTITVCFDPPTGSSQNGIITSFNVSYTGSPFQTTQQVTTEPVSPTEYPLNRNVCTTLTNLEENNNYDISVLLTNSAGSGPASTNITTSTLEAVPAAAPTNIALQTLGTQSIRVTICPPPQIDQNGLISSYTVSYTGNPFDASAQSMTVSVSLSYPATATACINANLTELEEFNNYTVTVRAVNSIGSSEASTGVTALTNAAVPDATPTISSLNVISALSIRVTICPPPGINQNGLIIRYIVLYTGEPFDTDDEFISVSISLPYPATTCTDATLTGLEEYNSYTVTVQAQNSDGDSNVSPGMTAQTNEAISEAPTQLAVSSTTATSLCITISPPISNTQNGPIQSYTVSHQGELFNTIQVNVSVSVVVTYPLTASVSECINQLEEFNNYTVSVRAINGAGEGAAITRVFRTLESAPISAPQNVATTTITATAITICFVPPTGSSQNGIITSFNVSYVGSPFQTIQQVNTVSVSPTEYPLIRTVCTTLTNLEENNNYDISVLLTNSAGSGPASTDITAITLEAVPAGAPTNIVLQTLGTQSIRVTICPPPQIDQNGLITGYTVSYTGNPFDTSTQSMIVSVSFSYPATATECSTTTLTGLEEFNNYTVTVRAVNSIGSSDASSGVTAQTNAAVSEAPSDLAVSSTTATSLCITISPPVSNTQNGPIQSYTVSYRGELFNTIQVNVSVSVVVTYPLTASSSLCINELEEFNNYMVSVRAINGAGEGAAITRVFRTSVLAPTQAPQGVTVETINSTVILVCFFPPQNVSQNGPITSFDIMYTGNPFETVVQSETVSVTPQVYPLTGMICSNLTNLQEFNNYTISVAAVNQNGTGVESTALTALTDEAAPSAPPQNFTAMSGLNITLMYIQPPPIDRNGILGNYTIQYSGIDRDRTLRSISLPPTQFSVIITGLEEDTTYSFRIRASTSVGQGPFTPDLITSTQTAPPSSPPINVTINVVNSTALNAIWRIPDIDEHNGLLLQVEIQVKGINLDTTVRSDITVTINDSNDTSIQFYIINGLEEFVNYSIILRVRNGAGLSPPSNPLFETTLDAAPSSPPQNVTTQALSPTSIEVTFVPTADINQNGLILRYNVTYTGQTFDTVTQFVIVNVTNAVYPSTIETFSVNLTGLQEYNNYTIRVSAINGIGAGPFSDGIVQITNIAAPSESPTLTVQSVSTTDIVLIIIAPTSIEQNGPIIAYEISIVTFRFSIPSELRNTTDIPNGYPLTINVIFNASTLQEFVEYNISVRAYTATGPSVFSSIVQQTTLAAAPSSPPQNVTAQALSPTTIRVTFVPTADINQNGLITRYNVTYTGQTFDTVTQFVIVNVTNAVYPSTLETFSVNLTGLQEYNNYTIRVSAINGIGAGPFSDGIVGQPFYLPDVISLSISSITFFTAFVSWNSTDRTPFLTESYTLVYSRVGSGQSNFQTIPDGSTTFTLTELSSNSEYTVYINATNRFGSTLGPTASFSTERVRLYFIKDGSIVPFSTGSIFRGGIHSEIFDVVSQYHCYPDSPDQVITWYQPNGAVIPQGTPSSTGFYHTRDITTGESVFYTNNAVSADNDGNNFTCSFDQTSGVMNVSSFGIYYARKNVSIFNVFGIRLCGPKNVIYEFVYQRGIFNLDFTQLYTVECLVPSLQQANYWRFIPDLLSQTDITTTNTTLYQVQFNSSANCQNVRCAPFVQYTVFSNKAFLLQTSDVSVEFGINCILNDNEFSFNLGSPLAIAITCPLIFGAKFLDIDTDITLIQNDLTTNSPRRLWVNSTATIATLDKEREYVCVDRYGEMVSFRISINAAGSEPIQILASGSSTVPIVNGTNLVGSASIPDTLLCVTQSASNAANWYVDSNSNRNTVQSRVAVITDSSLLPHVVSPRAGRSNLVLNGTIGNAQQGYYSCVTNPTIVLGIFSQTPVAPAAEISPNQASIQVVIGTNTSTLNCITSNVPFPAPIYFWTGSVSSPTAALDTGFLLEADTGVYTCTASNVVGMSADTTTINIVPPPPQFISIQLETNTPIYINDSFALGCQFSTFSNVTSQINILWYLNEAQVVASTTVNINTSYSGSVAISSLTVSSSQIVHTGDYQCRATVGGSQQAISINLHFNFDPPPTPYFISINLLTEGMIVIGDQFVLACEFMTIPRFIEYLSISWYHNDVILISSSEVEISESILGTNTVLSTLSISTATLSQSGAYHCVASVLNSIPSISSILNVTINTAPTPVLVSFNLLTTTPIYITDSFSLSCRFSTSSSLVSSLSITWFHNNTIFSILSNSALTSSIDGNTAISTLSISSAGYDRSGSYSCRAGVPGSSFASSNLINVNILPIPPPTFISIELSTQPVYLNESFQLFCIFNALTRTLPFITIKWYHNATEISPCHSRYLINQQHDSVGIINSTLETVSSVECQLGAYYCEANFELLSSPSDEYNILFETVPYQQEILSLEVFSDDSRSLYLQWDLSHSPLADERFIIKFTIQSADNSVAITKVDLSCDVTCDRDKRVSYQLTEIVTNSNYFAEVTVMNLYGESTKIYQFYPQAIISELIGSVQCTDNSATIAIPLVIIIFLLILVDIIIIVIFVIWYFRYYRTDKAKFKRKTLMNPGREYVEMSPRDTTTEGYYNLVEEVREDPQFYAERNIASLDAVSEPTYAHIDEDGKVIEEGNKDRDYEVMQSDDPTRVTYSNLS